MPNNHKLSYKQISAFFIPLGVSASLTSVTHVIINGTLSRGDNAAFIVACFAVVMSLFGIIERPMIIFRQTSSALVNDRKSFKILSRFFIYVLLTIMFISSVIAFSPIGPWLYTNVFDATDQMVDAITVTYQVISIVIIFSGIRGLYQGIIINQLATNWLTIGVVIRLIAMFSLSSLFIYFNYITSVSGALIFLVGMFTECVISVYKGHGLLKNKLKKEAKFKLLKVDISKFYFPLVFYFLMQTILIPIIYILLARSEDIEMSIASFALAFSITNMILGFFMYTHQLVLQFHKRHYIKKLTRFVIIISLIPTLLLCILCYTPVGMLFMQHIMGADIELSSATINVLKFFMIKTLIFPWVDFLNGFLMLNRQTNKMLFAQFGNLIVVILTLLIAVYFWPQLDGMNGSMAAALGELTGFIIVSLIIYNMRSELFTQRKPQQHK